MPVNFFDAHHTQSEEITFGLRDDSTDKVKKPAYIKEQELDSCQGIIKNPDTIRADFYGLDDLKILKAVPNETETESLCDGLLKHRNSLTFVELKGRAYSGWVSTATTQLINSVRLFSANHELNEYNTVEAFVCNSMRPHATQNHAVQLQRFKDETRALNFKDKDMGLSMDVKREIEI